MKGKVGTIEGTDGDFKINLEGGRKLKAKSVVLALGVPGPQACPAALSSLPDHLMFHSDDKLGGRLQELKNGRKVRRGAELSYEITKVPYTLY